MRFRPFLLAAALSALSLQAACTPTVATRGNMVSEIKLAEIEPQVSTRADVERTWGPPTTVAPFNDKVWYYIGETTKQQGIFEAEVERRQTIKVAFDDNGTVTEIAAIDPKLAKDIEPVDRKTPTAGKEYTALQQMIGNIGKFNTDGKASRSSIPGM